MECSIVKVHTSFIDFKVGMLSWTVTPNHYYVTYLLRYINMLSHDIVSV